MKVLIINTYDQKGGAAIAAKRLLLALNKYGIDARMLVGQKLAKDKKISTANSSWFQNKMYLFRLYLEKFFFIRFEKSKVERFSFSTALFGSNIHKHKLVQEADVLHFHWINHSYLSHQNFKKLLNFDKPIVVTMHDMWYMTGGCHHARECLNYLEQCGNCQFLKNPHAQDLSNKEFLLKNNYYSSKAAFVGCSEWLSGLAKNSALLKNNKVLNIPNPIDIDLFKKKDKIEARNRLNLDPQKKYILYAAANVNNPRKGYKYLEEALKNVTEQDKANLEILLLGREKGNAFNFSIPYVNLGYINSQEKIIDIYNAVDLYVSPTLEDNLPNTIMESMACGTPSVAFNIGGVPQLIDHKINGYVAMYKDSVDLWNGIQWILQGEDLSIKCTEKVKQHFSEKIIVKQYQKLYNSLLSTS